MRYITDIHALNIPCRLGTTGDWHMSALQWENPRMLESEGSIFGDYGIEVASPRPVPEHEGEVFNIANHIRACLDMISQGRFAVAQGMNGGYFDDDTYDEEIFEKVLLLRGTGNWEGVHRFMTREYGTKWQKFISQQRKSGHK